MCLPVVCSGVKVDSPVIPMDGRQIKSEPELCDSYEDECEDKRNNTMDEFNFSVMTLKQLKERCKTKRRKLHKFVEVKEEPCSHLDEDYTKLHQKEDESDLEETLSNWKSKLSKKPKAKRKCNRKEVHSPSKSATSDSASEQTPGVPQDSPQRTGVLNGTIKTDTEISELVLSDCPDLDCFTFSAAADTCSTVDTSANVSDEVAGISNRSELAIGESTFPTTETPNFVVEEVSSEHLEHDNSLSHPASAVAGEVMEGFSEVIHQETLCAPASKFDANVRLIQSSASASPVEAPCITNKPAYEMFSSFMQWESCEIDSSSEIHMPHKLNGDNLYGGAYMFTESEVGSKEDSLPDAEKDDTRKSDVLYLSFQNSHPCSDLISVDCTSPTIEEKWNPSSLSTEGLVSSSLDMESEGGIKEDILPNPETSDMNNPDISSQSFHTCLNLPNNLEGFNSATDMKRLFPTNEGPVSNITSTGECTVVTIPSDVTESCIAVEVLKNFNALKPEHPPKRLCVARSRKVVSPTSQEKLHQNLDADYLSDDISPSMYLERQHFGQKSKIRASLTRSVLDGAEVDMNLQRIIMKPKNEKSKPNLLVPKGILKSAKFSGPIPQATTENTHVHPYAERAIAFSQRQMHDIECLSMKLVKELKSMKDVVEDKLHSEVYTTSSKYNVDETLVAVQKAGEVEETTRKWLSMMAKDCSRFCKIMRSSGKKASAGAAAPVSGSGLHNDRKKIIFADEAGGPLCHVKVFEDQLGCVSGSQFENEEHQASKTESNGCTLQY